MSPRPPTLRENRRYILARIEPAGMVPDQKDLYYAIADAVTSLWGDSAAGVIMPAVVAAENGHVFIRCLRGTEKELAIALSTVTGCREVRLALRIVAVSGTIESLRERIRDRQVPDEPVPETSGTEPGECVFAEKMFITVHCNGQKVDVIEKGFKNAHRLFLTRSDLENS
jgi:ribonuclease P/MRP protein subunit POP5